MSILDFKSNLLGGGARPNQFRVELNFPGFVSGGTAAARKAQFLCTAASLPGSHIGIAQVFYRGREVKLPGERVFQNWQITVINDTMFDIRDSFEKWMEQINGVKNNTGITNPLAVTTNMIVNQLDRNGAVLKSYTLADVWPVNLGEIPLSFGSNDQIEEFTVELAYGFWDTTTNASSVTATIGINTPIGGVGIGL
jgi:hypothetical protein